jgi:hypothetical protein
MSKKIIAKLDAFIAKSPKPTNEQTLAQLTELAHSNDPADRTVVSRFSLMKKHLRENHLRYSDKFLATVRPPSEMTQSIIELDRLVRSRKKVVEFDQGLVDKILALKESQYILDRFIFLQFVSGRRVNEIFSAKLGKAQKQLLNMQLSKKPETDKRSFFKVRIMPGTVTAVEFKKMLVSLRRAITGMSLNDFTSRINRRVKKNVRSDMTSHNLRALYAVYSFEKYNPDKQNLIGFVSDILNHGATSDSGVAYSNFRYSPS